MKKIMIDLDETICEGGYLEAVNEYLHTDYQYTDIPHYYVEDVMDEEEKEAFLDYFYQHVNIYKNVKVLPKALEVIEKLAAKYDIYIVTAFVDRRRVKESSIMAKYKYEWIIENMPYINPKHIVLTGSKDISMCDIKIDDKVANLKGYGETKLLLNHKHNENFSHEELEKNNIRRVYDWEQIGSILLKESEVV